MGGLKTRRLGPLGLGIALEMAVLAAVLAVWSFIASHPRDSASTIVERPDDSPNFTTASYADGELDEEAGEHDLDLSFGCTFDPPSILSIALTPVHGVASTSRPTPVPRPLRC